MDDDFLSGCQMIAHPSNWVILLLVIEMWTSSTFSNNSHSHDHYSFCLLELPRIIHREKMDVWKSHDGDDDDVSME